MIGRKLAFVLFLTTLLHTALAQIDRGTLMTGGSLGFQFTTDHEYHTNDAVFTLAPVFGGFVSRHFVLGVAPYIMYSQSSGGYSFNDTVGSKVTTVQISINNKQTSLGLGPYARYYIKIAPKVYVFIHGSPSIMSTWSSSFRSPIQRTISANWVIGPGLSVMLAKAVALEVSLYYQGTYHRSALFENGNLLGTPGSPYVDNGMVLNVGFQVYLTRKKQDVQPAKVD
jgi:hypothetical protein